MQFQQFCKRQKKVANIFDIDFKTFVQIKRQFPENQMLFMQEVDLESMPRNS